MSSSPTSNSVPSSVKRSRDDEEDTDDEEKMRYGGSTSDAEEDFVGGAMAGAGAGAGLASIETETGGMDLPPLPDRFEDWDDIGSPTSQAILDRHTRVFFGEPDREVLVRGLHHYAKKAFDRLYTVLPKGTANEAVVEMFDTLEAVRVSEDARTQLIMRFMFGLDGLAAALHPIELETVNVCRGLDLFGNLDACIPKQLTQLGALHVIFAKDAPVRTGVPKFDDGIEKLRRDYSTQVETPVLQQVYTNPETLVRVYHRCNEIFNELKAKYGHR